MAFQLSSPQFRDSTTIPTRFTCDGSDISPQLIWNDAPKETKSFALICDDPDAPVGTWVHWVIYNIPASNHELLEGIAPNETLPDGTKQGVNDFKRIGYGGPCPPKGAPHRYFFKLYALDTSLSLGAKATKKDLEQAMQGHTLAQATLVGTYSR